MPTIPMIERQGPGRVRAVQADIGQAVTGIGRTVSAIDDRMQQARRGREVNEAVTEATRRISEHEDAQRENPGGFGDWQTENKEFLETTRNDMSSELGDAAVRDAFNQKFNTMGVHSETRVRQSSRRMEISEGVAALDALDSVSAANYVTTTSPADRQMILDGYEDATDAAAGNGLLTPVQADKRVRDFSTTVERQRVLADIDTDPVVALDAIGSGAYELGEDDRRVAAQRAKQGIENLAVQLRRDRAAADKLAAVGEANDFVDLMDLGEQNLLQAEKVEAFRDKYKDSKASAREWLQLRNKHREQSDEVLATRSVTNALTGTGFISPDNRDQMKAADELYSQMVQRWDVAEIPQRTAWFTARLGVVVDTVRDAVIGPLGTMHDPDAVVLASDIIAQIGKMNPAALTGFHKNHIEKAVEIQEYTQGGLKPQAAIDLYSKVREVPTAITDSRDRGFTEFVRDGDYRSAVEDAVGDVFDVDAPPELFARAEKLARDNYRSNGNFEVSVVQAVTAARGSWAASLMDDDLLQFGAPGLHYGAPGKDDDANREWQQEQLTDNIEASDALRDVAAGTDGNYIVTTHPILKTQTGKPVYSIAAISKADGTITHVGEWVPDYQSSKQFVRDTQDHDDVMQQLYKDREEFLKSPADRRKFTRAQDKVRASESDRYQNQVQDILKQQQFKKRLEAAGGS